MFSPYHLYSVSGFFGNLLTTWDHPRPLTHYMNRAKSGSPGMIQGLPNPQEPSGHFAFHVL